MKKLITIHDENNNIKILTNVHDSNFLENSLDKPIYKKLINELSKKYKKVTYTPQHKEHRFQTDIFQGDVIKFNRDIQQILKPEKVFLLCIRGKVFTNYI